MDLQGGYTDISTKKPWERDTVVNIFSTSKLVTNLAALMLISCSVLHPDNKVAQYWPEFAANGKSEVTVSQVLTHTAGICVQQDNIMLEDVYDIEAVTNKLANQAMLWAPGTAIGYHGITQGFLIGELVRRKTGISIDKFVTEEICRPLGDGTDFQLGYHKEDWNRVAPVVPPPGPSIQEALNKAGFEQDSIVVRTLYNPSLKAEDTNTALWRSCALGSVNGHTNTRALVKILSCFSLSGTCAGGGYRLLSAETVKLVLTEYAIRTDIVIGRSGRHGLGIYLTGPGSGIVEGKLPEGSIGWGSGWGGSIVVVDSNRRLILAYTMNRMLSEEHPSPAAFIKAVYKILGVTIAV